MEKKVPVNMSNKHIHLSQADVEALFGPGHQLTVKKELSQPGQFACEEVVDLVGPKGTLKKVRVLGPTRKETQIEVSKFDARTMGVPGVVRQSGKLEGTPGCKVVGPAGEIDLDHGVIVAARHIHFDPKTAEQFGVKDNEIVSVRVGDERSVIFEKVICRVNAEYLPDMHVDIEEGNAAGIQNGVMGEIL